VLVNFKALNIMYAVKIIAKNKPDKSKLYQTIATNETTAMINAMIGVAGKNGTRNGLARSGSVLRSLRIDTIDMIYSINAPRTENVMISPVFPARSAHIPMTVLNTNALAGVKNRGLISPRNRGANPTRPNSNVARPEASINPWKDAIRPNIPTPISIL
jgi:hypothetical protein